MQEQGLGEDEEVESDHGGLLATVHPESRWTYVGANPRRMKGVLVGRDGARKFLRNILRNLTIDFQPASS